MKRLIFLLVLITGLIFTANAQGRFQDNDDFQTGPDSLQGVSTTLTIYSPLIDGYWDYSIQLESTFGGLGDSTHYTVTTWQSNDPDTDAWTEMTSLRDTSATITDESCILIEKTDFTGLWLKHILTSASLDTMLIESFTVIKKFRLF